MSSRIFGQNFPVSDYYKGRIIDAQTLSRTGTWWTAVLLIDDPGSGRPILGIYRWQKVGDEWKVRKSFSWKKSEDMDAFLEVVAKLKDNLS